MSLKKPLIILITVLIIFCMIYPIVAFAEWNWKIGHWHMVTRYIVASVMLVFMFLISLGVYSEN